MTGMNLAARARRSVAALLLVASALSLTSCVAAFPGTRAPAGDPIKAARALADAPGAIQEGLAADTCGEFVLGQNESVPADAIACLDAATIGQQEAELAWSDPTTEGDPIVYFASVSRWNENVVLFMTNAFDSYGGDFGWTSQSCADASTAVNDHLVGGCQDLAEG